MSNLKYHISLFISLISLYIAPAFNFPIKQAIEEKKFPERPQTMPLYQSRHLYKSQHFPNQDKKRTSRPTLSIPPIDQVLPKCRVSFPPSTDADKIPATSLSSSSSSATPIQPADQLILRIMQPFPSSNCQPPKNP